MGCAMDERTELDEISRLLGGGDTGPGRVLDTLRGALRELGEDLGLAPDDDPFAMVRALCELGRVPLPDDAVEDARAHMATWDDFDPQAWSEMMEGACNREWDEACPCAECAGGVP